MNTREKTPLRPEPPISEAVKAELVRRRATYERDRKTARPWEEIMAEQRQKLTRS